MSAESNPVPAGRFARVNRHGIAIVTADEAEGMRGYRESLALFKRAWCEGYARALEKTGIQTDNAERLEKWRVWYAEDAEKQFAVEYPERRRT